MALIFAVDFDGTVVVNNGRAYSDITTPLVFMSGAKEALLSLRAARHKLLLWSGRARLALRDPLQVDPLVRAGVKTPRPRTDADYEINRARFAQMVAFVTRELPGVFDYIYQGGEVDKPGVDVFIDDLALRFGETMGGQGWPAIARAYGA